jgi:hypothetical protein
MKLPTRSLTILFGRAMQHHSCHVVFWFIALSGRCFQKAGLWTKPPAFLGLWSSKTEKTRHANRGQWGSPIGRQEFDPQGGCSFTMFECRHTSAQDLLHRVDEENARGRRSEPYTDSSSMPPVVMRKGQIACDRIGIGELKQTRYLASHSTRVTGIRGALLCDPSQQGLPLGRDLITYLFIKFAERSLETKQSISFAAISYRRDYLQLSSSMQSSFMPFDMMLYPVRRTLRLSLRISRAGCTGQL